MVMTHYKDKLAWKLFDVHTLKDAYRGVKNKFSGGNGFKSNSQDGRFSPIKAQEQANMSMLPQPEQPAQPEWEGQIKQAAFNGFIPELTVPVNSVYLADYIDSLNSGSGVTH